MVGAQMITEHPRIWETEASRRAEYQGINILALRHRKATRTASERPLPAPDQSIDVARTVKIAIAVLVGTHLDAECPRRRHHWATKSR